MADYNEEFGAYIPTPEERAYLAACGCPQCATSCDTCVSAPGFWTTTLAGITNGTCGACGSWNRDYLMPYIGASPDFFCQWREVIGLGCSVVHAEFAIVTAFNAQFTIQAGLSLAVWQLLGAVDCLGPNVLSLVSTTGDCANLPATITVSPA